MGVSEIQSILTWGGPGVFLIVCLVFGIIALWRYNGECQKRYEAGQQKLFEVAQEAARAIDRSTSVINQLAEVERQRAEQISAVMGRLVDRVDNIGTKTDTVYNYTTQRSDTVVSEILKQFEQNRQGVVDQHDRTRQLVERSMADIQTRHTTWESSVRELVTTAMTEIRGVRELLIAKRGGLSGAATRD